MKKCGNDSAGRSFECDKHDLCLAGSGLCYCGFADPGFGFVQDGDVVRRDSEAGGRKVRGTLATGSVSAMGMFRQSTVGAIQIRKADCSGCGAVLFWRLPSLGKTCPHRRHQTLGRLPEE